MEVLRFVVMSDSQAAANTSPDPARQVNGEVLAALVDRILELDPLPRFVFFLGDMAFIGGRQPLAAWKSIVAPLLSAGVEIFPAKGNHELTVALRQEGDWSLQQEYLQAFPGLPDNGPEGMSGLVYSFECGPAFFAVLDPFWVEAAAPPERPQSVYHHLEYLPLQLDWLRRQSRQTRKRFRFAFAHAPAFSVGEDDSSEYAYRHELWRILDDARYCALFAGHEHLYGRWRIGPDMGDSPAGDPWRNGVVQIICGGAGAPLWPPARFPSVYEFGHPEAAIPSHHFVLVDLGRGGARVQAYSPGGERLDDALLECPLPPDRDGPER